MPLIFAHTTNDKYNVRIWMQSIFVISWAWEKSYPLLCIRNCKDLTRAFCHLFT